MHSFHRHNTMRNLIIFITIFFIALCFGSPLHHRTTRVVTHGNAKFFNLIDTTIEDAGVTEFPWTVMILSEGPKYKLCGGALINPHTVLTAAHCVIGKDRRQVRIIAGVWNIYKKSKFHPFKYRLPSKIIVHDKYSKKPPRYDYAILIMDELIAPRSNINYVCVPSEMSQFGDFSKNNKTCIMTGWGKTNNEPYPQHTMKKVEMAIVDNESCAIWYHDLQDNNICAGQPGRKLVGEGDDGGPLICEGSKLPGVPMLTGIYSYTDRNAPGVYMSVAPINKWIEKHLLANELYYFISC